MNTGRQRGPVMLAAGLAAAALAAAGCAATGGGPATASAPARPWRPAPGALPAVEPAAPAAVTVPDSLLSPDHAWTLPDIVDLALANNPLTSASWADARAAAASLQSARGAYWPRIDATATAQRTQSAPGRQTPYVSNSFTPALDLGYVLFDFGKRSGEVEQARQALYQANWVHNQTIQDVALAVETTYYQYLSTKALHGAAAQAVTEAETNLDAAEQRRAAGLATLADALQARATLAQQKLAEQGLAGQILTVRGSLATAMGLSPTVDYDIGSLPERPPAAAVTTVVEDLIAAAQDHRPELAAARAAVLAARARAGAVKAAGLPQVSLQASVGRRYLETFDHGQDTYLAGVVVGLPLFTGGAQSGAARAAQAQAEAAASRLATVRSDVELQVWQAYYDLRTAAQRLDTAREFLDAATQSHDVAVARYKSGVSSILDLLATQTALQDARAQDVQARTDWYLAVAALAHATGRLGPGEPVATLRRQDDASKDGGR